MWKTQEEWEVSMTGDKLRWESEEEEEKKKVL